MLTVHKGRGWTAAIHEDTICKGDERRGSLSRIDSSARMTSLCCVHECVFVLCPRVHLNVFQSQRSTAASCSRGGEVVLKALHGHSTQIIRLCSYHNNYVMTELGACALCFVLFYFVLKICLMNDSWKSA